MTTVSYATNKFATVAMLCLLALAPCRVSTVALAEQFSERRISVRGVRPELWDWLYVESAKSRVPLGTLLNVLITDWQAHTPTQRRVALEQYRRKHHEIE